MMKSLLKRALLASVFFCLTTVVFAEDAPVYDVDSYPPQFDTTPPPNHATDRAQANTSSNGPAQTFGTQDAAPPPSEPEQQQTVATPPTQSLSVAQRISRLENSVHGDVSNKVSDLQAEVQTLRGQVEDLTHQLQQLQSEQKTQYSDLDKRLTHSPASATASASSDDAATDDDTPVPAKPKKVSKKATAITTEDTTSAVGLPAVATTPVDDQQPAKPVAKSTPATASAADQPNVAEEQQIYQTAYNLIKAKKYSDAADTLQKMLQKYPSGQFAANAHYWLGELFGLMGKNDQSITEFATVVKNYPDSPKIADAQLKLGLIYAAQLKWPDARTSFKKVINHYPGTASAHLASEQLKQIKQAGH